VEVAVDGERPRPGDIVLRLGAVPVPASASGSVVGSAPAFVPGSAPAFAVGEAYRVRVAPWVTIEAPAAAGVFNGTRSVLQWLRRGWTIRGGTALDWPSYPERGLMLDVGRKHFSLPWLRERIRELGDLKLNYLHLHLSDAHGFRLESDTHPEIVSSQHYSKRQIGDLVAYAARRHVQVVPEIDFPGHMDAILAAHPDLLLVGRTGAVCAGSVDLSKPAAYALMGDLITEFAALFPGTYWHLGADEYVLDYDEYPQLNEYAVARHGPGATGRDTYHAFVNWANELVRAAGRTTRIWNDGLKPGATVAVDADVVVEHWSANGPGGFPWTGQALTPGQLAAAGHRVHNAAFTPTYYVTGGTVGSFNVPAETMYDAWDPTIFVDGSRLADHLGAKLHVWCDDPEAQTEAQIAAEIADRLQVMAQLTWGSPRPPSYLRWRCAPDGPRMAHERGREVR
jgi:hexosaminidase